MNVSNLVPGSATKMSSLSSARASCVLPFQSRLVDRSLLGRPVPWERERNHGNVGSGEERTKARFNGRMEAPEVDTRVLKTQQGPAPAVLQDMASSHGLLTLGYIGPTPTLTLGCCSSVKMPQRMMENTLDPQVWFGKEVQMGCRGIPVFPRYCIPLTTKVCNSPF